MNYRTWKKILQLLLTLVLVSSSALHTAALDDAEEELHYLVFASDYHSTEGSIENAMIGMPDSVEYICLIGDMVGSGRDFTPEYNSSMILQTVRGSVFSSLSTENIAILWASHDDNVSDDSGIVKCAGGYGSDVIYEGLNEDGSVAYYIYGIAHYEMTKGSAISQEAAQKFKDWVSGVDHTIPILVLCHVPMVAKRGDNAGAIYWNEALNYAATGVEGIVSTEQTGTIIRDVIFLSGHNHTVDPNEYYCPAGSTMNIQIDSSAAPLAAAPNAETAQAAQEQEFSEEAILEAYFEAAMAAADEEDEDDPILQAAPSGPRPPRPEPKGVISNVYYTSLTAGYLKTSGNASLLTIGSETIVVNKYNGGENVSIGIDPNNAEDAGPEAVITRQTHIPSEICIENTVDPTCEDDGHHDEAVYCTVCDKEMERTEVTDEALGHDWGEWKVTKEPTESAEGQKERVCGNDPSHVDRQVIDALQPEYTMTGGTDSSWTKGSGNSLVLTVQRSVSNETLFRHFQGIVVDGKTVPQSAYTVNETDGTILLAGSYLETLAAGVHSIRIQFDDGAAETQFTVLIPSASHLPADTGDGNGRTLYTSELILSLGIFMTAVFCRHRYAGHH